MKKAIIALIALAAAAGISIGAFIAVKSNSEKETKNEIERQADNVLFDFDSISVNKVDIINADGSYTAEYDGSIWYLTQTSGDSFDLNQTTVQGICTFISSLTASTSYGEATEENKAKYGLLSPYAVTVSDGENEHTLYIGDKSPTGDYYYAYTAEKNNIYAIAAADAESILTNRLSLKNDKLISYDSSEIVGMTLKKDGEIVYDLRYDNELSRWMLPEKYDMLTVNQTRASGIVTLITRLTAEEMIVETPDDFTKYGFDKPFAEFIVKSSDGSEKTILMSRYGQNSITYTYVYVDDCKQVETYYTADLDFIEYDTIDFIMRTIECANINTVAEIEISGESVNDIFIVNTAEKKAECRGNEIDLNNAELFSFFENFFNVFSYVRITDIDVEIQPEIIDPIFSAKYTLNDGTVKTIDFVSSEKEGLCCVFADGEYTGSLTSDQFIYGSDSVLNAYELLCRQSGIEPNNTEAE